VHTGRYAATARGIPQPSDREGFAALTRIRDDADTVAVVNAAVSSIELLIVVVFNVQITHTNAAADWDIRGNLVTQNRMRILRVFASLSTVMHTWNELHPWPPGVRQGATPLRRYGASGRLRFPFT
jgi:hypothetical protein